MKDRRYYQKRCAAWFLLLALCLHRIMGFVGNEVVIAIELEAEMNETEQFIAGKLKTNDGLEANVQVQNTADLESLQKLGYLAPFIFSEEIDSSVCFYTVEYSPKTRLVSTATEKGHQQNLPSDASNSFNKRVLSNFYFWENTFTIAFQPFINTSNFTVPQYGDHPFIAIHSPPPKYFG